MTNLTSIVVKVDSTDVKKASDHFNQFGRDGKKAERDINRFGNQASKTAKQTKQLSSAAQTLTRVLGAVGVGLSVRAIQQFAQESLRAAQNIERQARSLGVTAAEFQRLEFTFRQFGGDSSDLSDAFATLADRAQDAKDGMQSFIDDFKLVGIEVDELRKKDPQQLFRLFADGIASVDDPTRRVAAAVRILGDDLGRRILPLLQDGSGAIDEFGSEASVLSTQLIKDSSRIQKEMAMITSQINTELQGAMLGFLVANEDAIIGLTKALRDMMRFVAENDRLFQALTVSVSALTAIKLAQWALAAATGLRGLAGAAALLSGPGSIIVLGAAALGGLADQFERSKQRADEFSQSLTDLSLNELEQQYEKLRVRNRELQNSYDQLNPFDTLSPEAANEISRNASQMRVLRESIDNITESGDPAEKAIEDVGNAATVAGGQMGRSAKEAQNLANAFASAIPAIDLLEPAMRGAAAQGGAELKQAQAFIEMMGERSNETAGDLDDLGDSGSNAADKISDDFSRVAGQIEGAFANTFEQIFRTGEVSFANLASNILDIYFRMMAEMAAQAIVTPMIQPVMGAMPGMAGGSAPAAQGASSGVTSLLQGGTQAAMMGGGNSIGMALQGAGQALFVPGVGAGTEISGAMANAMGPAAPTSMRSGEALTGSFNPFGNAGQVSNMGFALAGIGGGIAGGAIGGEEGAMIGSIGSTVGMAMGGPVGAVIGSVAGGLIGRAFGESSTEKAIKAERELIEARAESAAQILVNETRMDDATRKRERELRHVIQLEEALDEGNKRRLEEVYALEEMAERLQEINRINDEREGLERRYLEMIGDTNALRQMELDATEAANRGILRFIFTLEDAAAKVARAEANARQAFDLLQQSIRREQAIIQEQFEGPIQAIQAALSRLESRAPMPVTQDTRSQAMGVLETARRQGIGAISQEELDNALEIVSDPSERLFGSFEEYQRDFNRTRSVLDEILVETETTAEKQLAQLTSQLEQGERMINALFGIDNRVLSVADAMNNLQSAVQSVTSARANLETISSSPPSFNPRPTPPATLTPGATDDPLWESILGAQFQAHIDRFGVSWHTSRTSEAERQAALAQMQQQYMSAKGFADGGVHTGGMRIVGERGPELEATGPSRIMSHEDMMSGLRGDNMVAELRSLKEEVAALRDDQNRSQFQIVKNTKRTRDTLEKFDIDGLPPERT